MPEATPPTTGDDALVSTLWRSPYMAVLQDAQWRLADANEAFAAYCGRPRESLREHDPLEFQPAEDHDANLAHRAAQPHPSTVTDPLPPLRRRLIDARGQERWFDVSTRAVHLGDGQWYWLSVLQDVTAEQQARDEGRRAQDELETWFEMCPAGMLVFDDHGFVVRTNAAFEAMAGATLVNLEDAPPALRWLLGWPGLGERGAAPQRWYPTPMERESAFTTSDGRPLKLMARVRGVPGDVHRRRAMAVVVDRSAEAERDLARREIGVLMDTASIGVATFDSTLGWLQPAPPVPQRRAGDQLPQQRHSGSLQGISREIVDPGSRPAYERLQQALREHQRAEARYAVNHPESGRRWLLTRVEPQTQADRRVTMSVVTLDITEQEQARLRNEQLLRELSMILEGSAAGIAYLRDGLLVRCNLRFERLLGLAPGEAVGTSLAQAFGRRLDTSTLMPAVAEALAGDGLLEIELPLRPLPGSSASSGQPGQPVRPAAWYALSLRRAEPENTGASGPAPLEAVAALTDISRLKAQQADLEAALRDRALMFDLSDVGIATMQGSRIEHANQAMAALTGYAAAELSMLDGAELYETARECIDFEAAVQRALRTSGRFTGERRLRRRDGRLPWVQVSVRPLDDARPEGAVLASFVDVDERHRAREALQLQAERTRAVLDSVLVGIVTVSARGIEWMNRSARRMFGGELSDFVGQDIRTVATEDTEHPLRRSAEYLARLVEGQAEMFECQLRARDGRRFWVAGNVVVTGQGRQEAGQGAGQGAQLTFALLDIERRRQAEMHIAQAQASLQRVIETAPLAIAVFDVASHRVLQMNQIAAEFFGRPLDQVVGLPPSQCMSAPRAAVLTEWLDAAVHSPDVMRREWREGRSDERPELKVWDVRLVALAASDAAAAQLLLAASDVTEQREADQARLQAAIAQREGLVREVHHRIKNNLQGVAGLLQQSAWRHPELATQLNEAVSQVHAIAQVYGLQVGSGGPPRVVQVLEAIAGSVARTFGREIRVAPAAAAVSRLVLREADAIPVALTLNEVLTNAVKHSTAGTAVDCACAETEPGVVELSLRNAGRLPEGFDLLQVPSGVAGLGLARSLLPRKAGSLSLEQQGGEVLTRIVLRPPSVVEGAESAVS